jgi:hypothetical protein
VTKFAPYCLTVCSYGDTELLMMLRLSMLREGLFIYRVSQEERSIFWEIIVSVILRKKVYMNMFPIPNGFRYLARSILNLARNILFPFLSMRNHSSQLTLHTDSHASDIGALRWEGRKMLSTKKNYCAPDIGNRSEQDTCSYKPFFLEWSSRILTFPPGTYCITNCSRQ